MDVIRHYIMSVIAAALICSIVNGLIGKKGTQASIIRLISGLFLTVTIIAPLKSIELTDISSYINSFSLEAAAITADGSAIAETEKAQLIKEKTEAYIQDKATSLGLQLAVDVTLNQDSPPLPDSVRISGAVAPFAKRVLTQYITDTFAIAEEDQLWN